MTGMVMCVFDGATVRLLHHEGGDEPVTLATFNVGHLTQDETISAAFELHDWYMRRRDPVAKSNGNGHNHNGDSPKRSRAPKQFVLELRARALTVLRMSDVPLTARQIADELGLAPEGKYAVYRLLKVFIADGLVERIGGYPYRYRATAAAEQRAM